MTTRRDGDRKDRDRDEYPNKRQPVREAAPSTRVKLDEFFLDGEGIDRQVLQSSICRFLGAEATSRPFEYQGRQGYKIRAIRPFTPDMIDDLKSLSREFAQENRNLRRADRDEVRYEESQTRIRKDLPPDSFDYDHRERNYASSSGSYPTSGGYPSEPPPAYPQSMYTTGPYSNTMYSMAPPGNMPSAYNDPRFPQDYQYPPGAREMQPGPYGYPSNSVYPDPGRSRAPDMQTGFYPTAGQNLPPRMMEDPRDPRFSGYDSMTGVQQTGSYGVPPRGQNPSPYDSVPRDHYNRPPPTADTYGPRRR